MNKRKKTVAVALSGGIDSACAAALLKDEGWEVAGVHLILPVQPEERAEKIRKARLISRKLHIPLYLLDVRDLFQRKIIDYFIDAYRIGLTPNPCVACNSMIKFDRLIMWIDERGIDYLSTGHYARVEWDSHLRQAVLLKGRDKRKDQSYFLHRLNQSHLSKALFPLGNVNKRDLYEMAEQKELPRSIRSESQEICFIPDNDYRSFLKSRIHKETLSQGTIIDLKGTVVGVHSGTYAFTVGQRHGLGISSKEPVYVCSIRPDTNEIVVGPRSALFTKVLAAHDFNWIGYMPDKKRLRVQAQIRYRHKAARGALTVLSPDSVRFEFDEPQRAVAPGQALVCYEGERVLGGGWIGRSIEEVP